MTQQELVTARLINQKKSFRGPGRYYFWTDGSPVTRHAFAAVSLGALSVVEVKEDRYIIEIKGEP